MFVSHNMGAVLALCEVCLWLNSGQCRANGPCPSVVEQYSSEGCALDAEAQIGQSHRVRGQGPARLTGVALEGLDGRKKREFLIGEPFQVELSYSGAAGCRGTGWVVVNSSEGVHLCSSFMRDACAAVPLESNGRLCVRLDPFGFLPGRYTVTAGLFAHNLEMMDWCEHVISFDILRHFADGRAFDHRLGVVTLSMLWTHITSG